MAYTQDVNGDIVISGWEEGILDDPYKGIYDMRNVALRPFIASGPANLKSYNTNLKANIKTINTNVIANVKTLDTNV